jgi:hypothetical protein
MAEEDDHHYPAHPKGTLYFTNLFHSFSSNVFRQNVGRQNQNKQPLRIRTCYTLGKRSSTIAGQDWDGKGKKGNF